MRRLFIITYIFLFSIINIPVTSFAKSYPQDCKGSKDHPLLTRMSDHHIGYYEEKEYDRYKFKDSNKKDVAVEGRFYKIKYVINKGNAKAGAIQIIRNYKNAIMKIGGTQLYADSNNAYFKIRNVGAETWVHLFARDVGYYHLTIIERQDMEQEVVADANAAQMAREIRDTGRVVLYGIYFDTDKSDLKNKSESTLKEIAKFMKENPSIKIYVVGHTDSVGSFGHNKELSEARAISVVNELTKKYGISAGRLAGYGVGPLCPVQSNKLEAGKRMNRRVELVEQ
ncbi:MAG: OmpA family protein [Sedimentisphaerales bacterium]|nr:OmpA family protein [Sedimentisphaerales bacterium]